MTELLEQAVNAIRKLPAGMQDDLARMVLSAAGVDLATIVMSPEDEASFDESLAQESQGEFATEAQISAIWAKHGL